MQAWLTSHLGQGWPMMLLGSVPLGIAIYLLGRGLRLRWFGTRVPGHVTGYSRTTMSTTEGSRLYHLPVVRFTALDGQHHEFKSIVGERTKRWPVGAEVALYYLPQQPQRAEIAGFGNMWLLPLGLGVLGALPFLIGVLMSMSA